MSEKTLIIAPWGMPPQWQNVIYELEGEPYQFCTTLPLLLRKFKKADVALIVLDSLVDEYKGKRQESPCYECYEKLRDSVRRSGLSRSYDELREGVKGFVKAYVECLMEHAGEKIHDLHVVVAPAVGSPGGTWAFEGNAADFEAVSLYELGELCTKKPYERIVLDLSHGINFMPALTLRLAEKLASILLTAHAELLERGVELLVYNSDPIGSKPMRINQIAKARVKSVHVPHELPRNLLRPREKLDDERVVEVNRYYVEAVRFAISALHYPMPLALCASKEKAFKSLDVLERALKLWLEHTVVEEHKVRRRLSLNPDGVYALLLSSGVVRRLKGLDASYPTDVKKLEELAKLYQAVNENYYYLIMDELGRIEDKLQEKGRPEKIMLFELLDEEPREKRLNKRVMIAHTGLQKEFVIIEEGKLRYMIEDSKLEEELENVRLLINMVD
jgi:CRISPR-associated protein Csx1